MRNRFVGPLAKCYGTLFFRHCASYVGSVGKASVDIVKCDREVQRMKQKPHQATHGLRLARPPSGMETRAGIMWSNVPVSYAQRPV